MRGSLILDHCSNKPLLLVGVITFIRYIETVPILKVQVSSFGRLLILFSMTCYTRYILVGPGTWVLSHIITLIKHLLLHLSSLNHSHFFKVSSRALQRVILNESHLQMALLISFCSQLIDLKHLC